MDAQGFVDKKDRTIIIDGDDDVAAKHDGRNVGRIQFDICDSGTCLFGMDVDDEYRRAGIATAMMKRAVEIYGPDFEKPSFTANGCNHAASHTYYTEEGAAFIHSCIEKGILDDTEPIPTDIDEFS